MDLGEGVSGPKAKKSSKSPEKVSWGLPAPGSQKSKKSLEKGMKSLRKSIFRLFGDFFETFFGLLGPRGREAPGDFSRLFGFWPRDSFSQVHATSSLEHFFCDQVSAPLVHTNFPASKANGAIGPYEFPLKFVWTNGSQISLKASVILSGKEQKTMTMTRTSSQKTCYTYGHGPLKICS